MNRNEFIKQVLDYKTSRAKFSDFEEHNSLLSNERAKIFAGKIELGDGFQLIVKGKKEGDDIFIKEKRVSKEENIVDASRAGYSRALYNDKGDVKILRRHINGSLDSKELGEPSEEFYLEGTLCCRWHVDGRNITNFVRLFCEENNIDYYNLSPEDKVLIKMNIV